MSKKSSVPKTSKEDMPRCLKFLSNNTKNTIKSYFQAIWKYEEFHNMTIEELVNEALTEQCEQKPMHQLTIIDRIEEFQEALIQQEFVYGSIKNYVARIKSIYHKNRVNIPYIEPLNPKRAKRREYIEFKDVLTKDEIKQAIIQMRLPAQARALAMVQGGLSNEECDHLNTRSFIDELHKYHQKDDDLDALEWLADPKHPVIWVTKLTRIKTGKPYYAILGAEAVNKIAEAKLYEITLPKNRGLPLKLLNMNKDSFGRVCREINKRCGFGLVAEESKFKPHNLRRFHATYIRGGVLTYEENMTLQQIDELQGRGKTNTQDTYIKTNPLHQKLLYAKVMNNLSLWHEYEYHVSSDDVTISVVDQLELNKKLEKKIEDLSSQLSQRQKASEEVKKLRRELGNDVFDSMIADILNAS